MAASRNASSPEFKNLSGGSATPNQPVNGLGSDFAARDPHFSSALVYIGRVLDNYASNRSCLIQTGNDTLISCTYGATAFTSTNGATSTYSPVIGDMVLFCKPFESDCGFILSSLAAQASSFPGSSPAIPYFGTFLPTFAELMNPATFETENAALSGGGSTAAGPFIPGELSTFSEYQVGCILAKLYYRIQAGALASITLNAIDDLVDFVAHNLLFHNSAFKLEGFADYGRCNLDIYTGNNLREFAADQQGGAKYRIRSGWLASGISLQSVQIHDKAHEPHSDIWFDELGAVSIKSRTGSWMHKVNGIYLPKKKFEADDLLGEGDEGVYDTKPREGFKIDPPQEYGPMAFGCQIRDYIAWQTAGEYRFKRYEAYEKDWAKVETFEEEKPPKIGGGQNCSFGDMVQLNDTTGDYSKTRKGEAFCGVLPDGSVLLKDAWGSSVELRGGNIIITSPNDTEIVSGRRSVVLSGKDTILRAKKTVEVSSSEDKIRIRSGTDTFIDAKRGSIQLTALKSPGLKSTNGDKSLEMKGNQYHATGIVLKTNTQVLSTAPRINMVSSGIVSIMGVDDTREGQPLVFIHSDGCFNWSESTHYIYTGKLEKNPEDLRTGTTIFSKGVIQSGQTLISEKYLYSKSGCFTEKSFFAGKNIGVNGYVASNTNGFYVRGPFKDGPIKLPNDNEIERYSKFPDYCAIAINEENEKLCRDPYEIDDYDLVKFKYRKTDEYGTEEYKWFENFWQRQYENDLKSWNLKNDVDDDEEYVYPGKEHIDDKQTWITYKEENVFEDGTPKNPQNQKMECEGFKKNNINEMKFR